MADAFHLDHRVLEVDSDDDYDEEEKEGDGDRKW